MENNGFADVTWEDAGSGAPAQGPDGTFGNDGRPSLDQGQRHNSMQHGAPIGDDLDRAGMGNLTLECEVASPLKENDGSKDSYVSYLVTTYVCTPYWTGRAPLTSSDKFPLLSKAKNDGPKTVYGLCIPVQHSESRISHMRSASASR